MATIAERFRGITGNQDERTIQYVIEGALSDQDALNVTEDAAPLTYDFMPRQNIRVTEVDKKAYTVSNRTDGLPSNPPGSGQDIEEQDLSVPDGTYYTEAVYTRKRGAQPVENTGEKPDPADPDANFNTFSFEQSLETVHIRESTIAPPLRFIGTGGIPDIAGTIKINGINVTEKGTVEGADVLRPIGSFSYDYYPSKGDVDQAYLDKVTGMVGKTNSLGFFGKEVGSVLMTSASGRKRNETDWEFNFAFSFRLGVFDNIVGEGSNQIKYSAQGHEYVWVSYVEPTDPTDVSILIPVQVNVERVYEQDDLNQLFVPSP